MKGLSHIYDDANGVTCFDRYFEYLNAKRSLMHSSVYDFASNPEKYVLSGKFTWHDAYLLGVEFGSIDQAQEKASSSIRLRLLHQSHDSVVIANYDGVERFEMTGLSNQKSFAKLDLITHEISVLASGCAKHTILFDEQMWIQIEFQSMSVRLDSTVLPRAN